MSTITPSTSSPYQVNNTAGSTSSTLPVIYDKESWSVWLSGWLPKNKVEVLGDQPPQPIINWEEQDPHFPGQTFRETSMLLYFPKALKVDGVEKSIALNLISRAFVRFSAAIQFKDVPIESGWRLIHKKVIPSSCQKSTDVQLSQLQQGFRMPSLGEIAYAIRIHRSLSEGKVTLFTKDYSVSHQTPNYYVRCTEKIQNSLIPGRESAIIVRFNPHHNGGGIEVIGEHEPALSMLVATAAVRQF